MAFVTGPGRRTKGIDGSEGTFPAAQIGRIPHATPFELDAAAVRRAAETLHAWAAAPRFREAV